MNTAKQTIRPNRFEVVCMTTILCSLVLALAILLLAALGTMWSDYGHATGHYVEIALEVLGVSAIASGVIGGISSFYRNVIK